MIFISRELQASPKRFSLIQKDGLVAALESMARTCRLESAKLIELSFLESDAFAARLAATVKTAIGVVDKICLSESPKRCGSSLSAQILATLILLKLDMAPTIHFTFRSVHNDMLHRACQLY